VFKKSSPPKTFWNIFTLVKLPTYLQNFTQKDLTKVKKVFEKVLGGDTF